MRAAAPRDTPGAAAFPWAQAMALGLGRLGLTPQAFWAMSPREFASALGPLAADARAPTSRAGLADLMARFPDEEA